MIVSIGANGLAKQIYPLIEDSKNLIFIDTTINKESEFNGHPIYNNLDFIKGELDKREIVEFFIGIGNPIHRKKFHNQLLEMGAYPINIQSKSAKVYSNSKLGVGNLILDFCLIEWDVVIGNGNLINAGAYIHHDSIIGDFNEIMPGAKILGKVQIGNMCRIGSNSVILPDIKICDDVIIGAGAIVTRDISESGTYIGIPAKKR